METMSITGLIAALVSMAVIVGLYVIVLRRK